MKDWLRKIAVSPSHKDAVPLLQFTIVLRGCISNISKMDKPSSRCLISSILEYPWLSLERSSDPHYIKFVAVYSHFLSVMVSSLPKYTPDVTSKLVSEFSQADFTLQDFPIQHHEILSNIVRFIPTCLNSFPVILQKNFPNHKSSTISELTNYVINLLKMTDYCPDLQFTFWQLIIECCIKLDVELQNEMDDMDDDDIEVLLHGIDQEESDDEDVKPETLVQTQAENRETEENNKDAELLEGEDEFLPAIDAVDIKLLLLKLDLILSTLLKKTSNSFTMEALDNGSGVSLFNTMTSLFSSHVLPTHFTKLTQFMLFHVSQYQAELSDSFLVLLINLAFNIDEILEKRLKSIQYLASYIARAKNLSKHQVVFVVSYLVEWLNKYTIERECEIADLDAAPEERSHKQTGGMERFKLFYAAFQALLYIFCFRHQLLVKGSDCCAVIGADSEWECGLDKFFQRLILAKFNPLKFCDETVVYIFAKLAAKLNLCYCYSIIEHNKRERILQTHGKATMPSAVGSFRQKQEFLDMEAYFPFDPLVLPDLKFIVQANYIEWSDVNPEEDDDGDSGSHSSGENDEDDSASQDEDIDSDDGE